MYLYSLNPGTWHVAHSDGKGGWVEVIKSDVSAPCPDSISQWEYGTGINQGYDTNDGTWRSANITVKCS